MNLYKVKILATYQDTVLVSAKDEEDAKAKAKRGEVEDEFDRAFVRYEPDRYWTVTLEEED